MKNLLLGAFINIIDFKIIFLNFVCALGHANLGNGLADLNLIQYCILINFVTIFTAYFIKIGS